MSRAELAPYEWCLLRVVPRVERGEQVNAGVVVYCQSRDVLLAAVDLDEQRALALAPDLDVARCVATSTLRWRSARGRTRRRSGCPPANGSDG